MRPAYIYRLRPGSSMLLCLLLSGCGQTGYLYLVNPPSQVPQATTRAAPVPSSASIAAPPAISTTRAPSAATQDHP